MIQKIPPPFRLLAILLQYFRRMLDLLSLLGCILRTSLQQKLLLRLQPCVQLVSWTRLFLLLFPSPLPHFCVDLNGFDFALLAILVRVVAIFVVF